MPKSLIFNKCESGRFYFGTRSGELRPRTPHFSLDRSTPGIRNLRWRI